MRKIRINPKALSLRWKLIISILFIFLIVLSTFATTNIAYIQELENRKSPSEWICKQNVTSIYGIEKDIFNIQVQGYNRNFSICRTSNESHSMSPWSSPDCYIIYFTPKYVQDIDSLDVGDIIIYENDDGKYIVHRIVEICKGCIGGRAFWTKGDNNAVRDTKVVYEGQIKGIVIGVLY